MFDISIAPSIFVFRPAITVRRILPCASIFLYLDHGKRYVSWTLTIFFEILEARLDMRTGRVAPNLIPLPRANFITFVYEQTAKQFQFGSLRV